LFRPAVSLAKRHRTFIIKSQNDEFAKIQRLENDFSIKVSLSTQHPKEGSVENLTTFDGGEAE